MTATAMIAMPEHASARRVSSGVRAITTMLKGSVVLAHAALLAMVGIGLVVAGGAGALNAAVGGALVIFFFAAGQGVQLLVSELDGRAGMGVVLASYGVRVVLLGLLLAVAMRSERVEQLFHPALFFGSVMAVLVAWLAGMFVAYSRLQLPTLEPLSDAPRASDDPEPGGER